MRNDEAEERPVVSEYEEEIAINTWKKMTARISFAFSQVLRFLKFCRTQCEGLVPYLGLKSFQNLGLILSKTSWLLFSKF